MFREVSVADQLSQLYLNLSATDLSPTRVPWKDKRNGRPAYQFGHTNKNKFIGIGSLAHYVLPLSVISWLKEPAL